MKTETMLNVTYSKYKPGEFGYWWRVTKGKTDIARTIYKGDINCSNSELTSLKGCPKEVLGDFICCNNGLKSLQNGPREVGFCCDCSYNELTSLEGAPVKIGEDMDCRNNNLVSLSGTLREVGGDFKCKGNPELKSLTGIGQVKGKIISDIK